MTPKDAALALVLALVLGPGCAGTGPHRSPAPLGEKVDLAARDLGGATVRVLDDGARVRVVDLWASWCEPCRDQLPALDRLRAAYGGHGLTVYAISFDADRAQLDAFLREAPVGLVVLWDKGGERLAEPLGIDRLPTTLVLDRAGVVRFAHVGHDSGQESLLEAEVRGLLGE
jgi:thiol-disulfide isomerase/thioredoxin